MFGRHIRQKRLTCIFLMFNPPLNLRQVRNVITFVHNVKYQRGICAPIYFLQKINTFVGSFQIDILFTSSFVTLQYFRDDEAISSHLLLLLVLTDMNAKAEVM